MRLARPFRAGSAGSVREQSRAPRELPSLETRPDSRAGGS
jgi:hypothetical protein